MIATAHRINMLWKIQIKRISISLVPRPNSSITKIKNLRRIGIWLVKVRLKTIILMEEAKTLMLLLNTPRMWYNLKDQLRMLRVWMLTKLINKLAPLYNINLLHLRCNNGLNNSNSYNLRISFLSKPLKHPLWDIISTRQFNRVN